MKVFEMKKVNYAVMVYNYGKYMFVTKLNGSFAEWEEKEKVLLMSKGMAEDLAFGLTLNGRLAMVVVVPNYINHLMND